MCPQFDYYDYIYHIMIKNEQSIYIEYYRKKKRNWSKFETWKTQNTHQQKNEWNISISVLDDYYNDDDDDDEHSIILVQNLFVFFVCLFVDNNDGVLIIAIIIST